MRQNQINANTCVDLILANKNDEIENTFCYNLFELSYFDEALLINLCDHIEWYIEHIKLAGNICNCYNCCNSCNGIVWIVNGTMRSVFYHLDSTDSYHIINYDAEIASKWSAYLERLTTIIERLFAVALPLTSE